MPLHRQNFTGYICHSRKEAVCAQQDAVLPHLVTEILTASRKRDERGGNTVETTPKGEGTGKSVQH